MAAVFVVIAGVIGGLCAIVSHLLGADAETTAFAYFVTVGTVFTLSFVVQWRNEMLTELAEAFERDLVLLRAKAPPIRFAIARRCNVDPAMLSAFRAGLVFKPQDLTTA